ncbi:MAG: hypothetical protein V4449_00060 [Patescibacteria group bacterium]
MRWAVKRQALYAGGIILVLLLLVGGGWLLFFNHKATCSDGILNQTEEGVDCGGVCATLCQAPRVSALWARAVLVAPGVYHAVALVRNPESSAGTDALPYTFQIFDDKNILIAERRGVMFLYPGEVVPLFEPNILTGERIPGRTFVTFGGGQWTRMERPVEPIQITSRQLDATALTLSAHIENRTATAVNGTVLTALLYDADDIVVAASQTKLGTVPPKGSQDAVFTWQQPFAREIVRTDIVARTQ